MKWLELKMPPVLVVAIFIGLMMVISTLEVSEFAFDYQSELSGLVAAMGGLIIVAGVIQFRRAKTTVNPVRPEETTGVVTSGIYSKTRNPMYLGMLLIITGWFFYLGVIANILLLPLFVMYLNRFQIAPEERMLLTLFGDEYRGYLTRVRRWL